MLQTSSLKVFVTWQHKGRYSSPVVGKKDIFNIDCIAIRLHQYTHFLVDATIYYAKIRMDYDLYEWLH